MNAILKNILRFFRLLALLPIIQTLESMPPGQLNPYWQDNDTDITRWIITQEELLTTTNIRRNDKIIGLSFYVATRNNEETIHFTLSIKMGTLNTSSPNPILLCSRDFSLETMLNRASCTIAPDANTTYSHYEHFFDTPFIWNGSSNLIIETNCADTTHKADILEAEQLETPLVATYGSYGGRLYLLNRRPKIGLIIDHAH